MANDAARTAPHEPSASGRSKTSTAAPDDARSGVLGDAAGLLFVLALYVAVLAVAWNGLGPRDAISYTMAALDLTEGSGVGDTHWALRWPQVLPMAGSLSLFGRTEFAASLPTFLYTASLIALSYGAALRFFDRGTAVLVGTLLATSTFFAIQAANLHIFLPETFFSVAAIVTLLIALDRPERVLPFLTAGLVAWLAWLCRETAAFLPPALCLAALVLSGPFRRGVRNAFATGCGFLAGLAAEGAFYALLKGDPLYRVGLSLGHGRGTPGTGVATLDDYQTVTSWLDPLVDALTDSTVVPVYVTALLGLLLAAVTRRLGARGWRAVAVFVMASALSFGLSCYVLSLENIYYYPVVIFTAHLIAALGLAAAFATFGRTVGIAAVSTIVAANFALMDVRNRDISAEPRLLADLAMASDTVMLSDEATVAQARGYLRLRGQPVDRVSTRDELAGPVPDGILAVDIETYDKPRNRLEVEPGWVVVERRSPYRPSVVRRLVRATVPQVLDTPVGRAFRATPAVIIWRTASPDPPAAN